MKLYLDNFKGFRKTMISFVDANFFVGENSTGKTAILNLMELMSNSNFWLQPSFNIKGIELGHFSEIVNQFSDDKSYFCIGIEFEKTETEGDKAIKQLNRELLKFKNVKGAPEIDSFKFIAGSTTVCCEVFEKKSVKLHFSDINSDLSFEKWIESSEYCREEIMQLPENSREYPYAVLKTIVNSYVRGKDVDFHYGNVTIPEELSRLRWIAPIRARAKRIYESYRISYSPEGDHIPLRLNSIISSKKQNAKKLVEALNRFGHESGLFDELKTPNFSKSVESPFYLSVKYGNIDMNITNVGYGVGQVLPIVVEMLSAKKACIAIQQPEVHLHPKAQAAFGGLVYDSITNNKNVYFIETHSEYAINRFRYLMYKGNSKSKIRGQVLFFTKDNEGTHVQEIPFDQCGSYPEEMPMEYGQFFVDEEMRMLEF